MGINFVENNKKLTDNEVILLINNGEYEKINEIYCIDSMPCRGFQFV